MRAWVAGVVVFAAACGPGYEPAPVQVVAVDAEPNARFAGGSPGPFQLTAGPLIPLHASRAPDVCAERGLNCGSIADDRGSVVDCGACPGAMTCSANVCRDPNARFIQVSVSDWTAAGVMSDRTLWTWFYDRHASVTPRPIPVQVGRDMDWSFVAHGNLHTCALKLDRTLWCWGNNYYGQVGTGVAGVDDTPRQVGTDATWKSVAVDSGSTCGIRADGTLWCWGLLIPVESDQELASVNSPALISSSGHWRAVTFRSRRLCALSDTGSLECWSQRYEDGRNRLTHAQPAFSWKQGEGSLAVRSDGTLWRTMPPLSRVMSPDTDWAAVKELTISRTDGSLWDLSGGAPQRIGTDTWLDFSVGPPLACGVRSDGSTWCWANPGGIGALQVHP